MMRHPDKIMIGLGVALLLVLVVLQSLTLWRNSREIVAGIDAARQLEAAVDKNDFPPPEHDAAEHSERVFRAWEDMPLAEPLGEWDFYPKPGAGN